MGGLVFGTLLGPEATGPGGDSWVCLFLVSWLRRSHGLFFFGRAVCGVCGLGLLFENYIVDASILYKKQFPRYMNLDLAAAVDTSLWGVGGCGWFSWFSRKFVFDLCGQVFKSTRWMPWH